MRPLCLAGLALAITATAGVAQDRPGPPDGERPGAGPRSSYANPSAVIAAELAFARDAQVRGQWTAFATAAANDAVMFVPQMVWAQPWLKGRANPPAAVRWQPHSVWSSCDGTLMLSRGAWQSGAAASGKSRGWYSTLWQRQPDGAYKWVLDHGGDGAAAEAEPDMISALVADCPPRARRSDAGPPADRRGRPAKPPRPAKPIAVKDLPPLDPARREGAARDGSLRWTVVLTADGARTLTVTWTKDGREQPIVVDKVAAAATNR